MRVFEMLRRLFRQPEPTVLPPELWPHEDRVLRERERRLRLLEEEYRQRERIIRREHPP